MFKHTPGGDDISCAVALQLQKEMPEEDLDKEGSLERVYFEPEALPTVSISSDDDTDCAELDGEYDSERDSHVDMRMEDDVDAPESVDVDGDVDMERDSEDEEDAEEEDKKEEEVVNEDEEEAEDEDENNGKEPRTIGHGVMLNSSADNADTMRDNEPTVLPEQGQDIRGHTPWPQSVVTAPRPQTPEPHPRPRTPETHTLSGMEFLGDVMPHKPCPAAPTLWEAEEAGNTLDVDVEQQLLGESAAGDSLPEVPLPDVPFMDVPLPDVSLPDVPLPDVHLPDMRLDDSVGEV